MGGPDVPIYIFPLMSTGIWNKKLKQSQGWPLKINYSFYGKDS